MAAKVLMPDGTWRDVTNSQPVNVKMPDGSWRAFGDSGSNPLKVLMPDGTWKPILYVPGGPLWYRADDFTGTSWPSHTGGFGPVLGPPSNASQWGGPPTAATGLNGQAAVQSWYSGGSPAGDSYVMDSGPSSYFTVFDPATGMTIYCLSEYFSGSDELAGGIYFYDTNTSPANYALYNNTYDGTFGSGEIFTNPDDYISEPATPASNIQMVEWTLGPGGETWRINGTTIPSGGNIGFGGPDFFSANGVQFGSNGNVVNTYELILFPSVLSSSELSTWRSYFAARYGISAL